MFTLIELRLALIPYQNYHMLSLALAGRRRASTVQRTAVRVHRDGCHHAAGKLPRWHTLLIASKPETAKHDDIEISVDCNLSVLEHRTGVLYKYVVYFVYIDR